jgi:methylated-DNA-protein-cysteine methyltransferase related protein
MWVDTRPSARMWPVRRCESDRCLIYSARMTPFLRAVRRVVRGIPRGTTLSYGEVALRAGKPRAARAVVSALHRLDDVPWWRVARHDGTLAPQVAREQATLLRQEGWKDGWKGRPRGRKRG